jgi:hypothetical protein
MMGSFDLAISKFDEFNSADPNREGDSGMPRELVYAQRMSECLSRFAPNASEEVRLAARCQHIGRWQIPRAIYPEGKKGYLQWRSKLKDFHAQAASSILRECGYDDDQIDKVKFLLLKKDLLHNPDSQLLEDVVCLVFVEFYLADFAKKHEPAKVIDILRKTMKKMSPHAKAATSDIPMDDAMQALIAQAGN